MQEKKRKEKSEMKGTARKMKRRVQKNRKSNIFSTLPIHSLLFYSGIIFYLSDFTLTENEAHGNTGYGRFEWNARIKHCQTATTHSGHTKKKVEEADRKVEDEIIE